MRRPNFFLAGAPKCGTTSMWNYLNQHPSVWMSVIKEPNYFCTDFPDARRVKSEADYMEIFDAAQPSHDIVGEASVLYFYSEVAAIRIRKFRPDAKVVIMLRNPVDMLPSQHSQLYYVGDENIKDFETAWNIGCERENIRPIPKCCRVPSLLDYKTLGYLSVYVERYLRQFQRDNLHFVLVDDLKSNPEKSINATFRFLGVEEQVPIDLQVHNVNKRPRSHLLSQLTRHKTLGNTSRVVRCIKRMVGLEQFDIKGTVRRLNKMEATRPVLSEPRREMLRATYHDDIMRLGDMIGKDLSHWLNP